MKILLLAFAQSRDSLGFAERNVECSASETPRQLLSRLAPQFRPDGIRVAIDSEYHSWDASIGAAHEMALIPPVSGG